MSTERKAGTGFYRSHKRPPIAKLDDAVTDQRTTIKWLERRNESKNRQILRLETELKELKANKNLGADMQRFGANFEDSRTVTVEPGLLVTADSETADGIAIRARGELRLVLTNDAALELATQLVDALEGSR